MITIGIAVEYCDVCGSPMSSDGCSNIDCPLSRPVPQFQVALQKAVRLGLITFNKATE